MVQPKFYDVGIFFNDCFQKGFICIFIVMWDMFIMQLNNYYLETFYIMKKEQIATKRLI